MEGAVKPKLEEVDLSAFITKRLWLIMMFFQAAKITLDFKVEAGLKMRTDEDLLDRILQNLLGNVLKHGKEEARLSLRKKRTACPRTCKSCQTTHQKNRKSQQPFLF